MKRIVLPSDIAPSVPLCLSVEEWAGSFLPRGEYFMAWQVAPSVICGRHQDIALEVDLAEARRSGVGVWRRRSGGGAVLADANNVMLSYIAPSTSVGEAFARYTSRIIELLDLLGIRAEATGRNDITLGDRKVAGNAFMRLPHSVVVHGTMLIDTDAGLMERVLTPSRAKRESKGVVSVPSRVTTLRREGLKLSPSEFIDHANACFCPEEDGRVEIGPADMPAIRQLMERYTDPAFLRLEPRGEAVRCAPVYADGVGQLRFSLTLDSDSLVASASLDGDFFALRDISEAVIAPLIGLPYSIDSFKERLRQADAASAIAGCSDETLLRAMFNRQ